MRQNRHVRKIFDRLTAKQETERGVSDIGIEVRRADKRIPGIYAHGYARVSSPEFHAQRAKQYIREEIAELKAQPKPNLPKSEGMQKARDLSHEYRQKMMMERALANERQRIRDYVMWAVKNKKPIESRHILLGPDHPYANPKLTDEHRASIFKAVTKQLKLPNDTPIIHNHTHSDTKLEIEGVDPSPADQPVSRQKIDWARMGYGGYLLPKRSTVLKSQSLLKLFEKLKKVDPKTKLPGILFQKKAAKGVDEKKFDSCVEQVKEKQGDKVNPYAICNATLKKQGMCKDDKPHPVGSPEERAHAVVEQGASLQDAIKDLRGQNQDKLKRFFDHLKSLKDKSQWRSPENVLIDRSKEGGSNE